jgi:hypothetical protein
MTELTSLRTDVGDTRTVAVESEDPELVQATRRELGLDAVPNVSFPRGLKALSGFGGRRFASSTPGRTRSSSMWVSVRPTARGAPSSTGRM